MQPLLLRFVLAAIVAGVSLPSIAFAQADEEAIPAIEDARRRARARGERPAAQAPIERPTPVRPPGASDDESAPWLVELSGGAILPLTEPQADLFGPGIAFSVGVHRPLARAASLGLRFSGFVLFDAPAEVGGAVEEKEHASAFYATAVLRIRLSDHGERSWGTGFYIEGEGGGGYSGEELKPFVGGGLGYQFQVGTTNLGVFARYIQVVQPEGQTVDDRDARLLAFGVQASFGDNRRGDFASVPTNPELPDDSQQDRDGDGVLDPDDACPATPEDQDGINDADGCPDDDDDGDGVPDASDRCPGEPEDIDGFEDEDGCPEGDDAEAPTPRDDQMLRETPDPVVVEEPWTEVGPDPDAPPPIEVDPVVPQPEPDTSGARTAPPAGGPVVAWHDDVLVTRDDSLFVSERAAVQNGAALEAIVAAWRARNSSFTVHIFSSVNNDEDLGWDLSDRRTRTLAAALAERGVPRASFSFTAHAADSSGPRVEAHFGGR